MTTTPEFIKFVKHGARVLFLYEEVGKLYDQLQLKFYSKFKVMRKLRKIYYSKYIDKKDRLYNLCMELEKSTDKIIYYHRFKGKIPTFDNIINETETYLCSIDKNRKPYCEVNAVIWHEE